MNIQKAMLAQAVVGAWLLGACSKTPPASPPAPSTSPSASSQYVTVGGVDAEVDGCASCDVWACMDLSSRYDTGDGVPKDPVRAREYGSRACNDCGYVGTATRGWCIEQKIPGWR